MKTVNEIIKQLDHLIERWVWSGYYDMNIEKANIIEHEISDFMFDNYTTMFNHNELINYVQLARSLRVAQVAHLMTHKSYEREFFDTKIIEIKRLLGYDFNLD